MTTDGELRSHGDSFAGEGLLDFAVNVWPGRHPAALRRAMGRALRAGYPDERRAVEAIARQHGRAPAEVLLLNGACEGFWLLAHTLRPARAACVHPSFTEPEAALRAVGAEVTRVQRRRPDFTLDPAAVPNDVELVVVGNPNNPTGNLDPAGRLLELVRPGRLLVVDESFMEFVPDERESLAGRRDLPGLVVVRSLTKLWSLAGVRAGYLLADAALVARLAGQRQPWSVNAPACAALELCLSDQRTQQGLAERIGRARADLAARLQRIPGLELWQSEANFLLLRVPDGPHVVQQLRARGIAVRPARSFPGLGDDHLRIAVRRDAENRRLVQALAESLAAGAQR